MILLCTYKKTSVANERKIIEPSMFFVAKVHGQRTREIRDSLIKTIKSTTEGRGTCGTGLFSYNLRK